MLMASVRKKDLGWVSLSIGTPLGNLRTGSPSLGNFEN